MSESVRELIKKYQAFYEVAPYYVLFEKRPPSGAAKTQRIHAGFDIDVYGVKSGLAPGPLSDYALAHAALQEVTQTVARGGPLLDRGHSLRIHRHPRHETALPTGRNYSDQDYPRSGSRSTARLD
jgi:hypothetical protein